MTHPEFVEVLARRIADYSGRDVDEVRSAVAYAGPQLPVRVAKFMLEELRTTVEDEAEEAQQAGRVDESQIMVADYQRARQRLIARLGAELGTAANPVGTAVRQQQQARADAERVFASAVDIVDPVALGWGVPGAVRQHRSAQIAAGMAAVRGLPAGRQPDAETVADWMDAARRLHSVVADPQAWVTNRQRLWDRIDNALRHAAGDGMYQPRTGARDPNLTFRDGIAVAWAAKTQRELRANLGIGSWPEAEGSLPNRFEGRLAAGFARSIAELSGRSEAEVLDVLCAAGGPLMGRTRQWDAARRLLAPDESLDQAGDVKPATARSLVVDAMRAELTRYYGDPGRMPDLTPEEAGARMAAAGAAVADALGIRPVHAEPASETAVDADLDRAMQASIVPRLAQAVGDREASSGVTSGETAAQRAGRPGPRGGRSADLG